MRRLSLFVLVLLAGALLAAGARAQTAPQSVYLPAVLSAPLELAFAGRPDAQSPLQIYTARADGSRLARLTDTAGHDNTWPSWSPDGRRIAFISYREGGVGRIYQMGADGGGQTRLVDDGGVATRYLRWSPDGSRIAFLYQWKVLSVMCILNLVSGQQSVLSGYIPAALAWSPDNQRIAYIDSSYDIRGMRVDQTDPVTITSTPERYENGVAWSPDGARLAFTAGKELYQSASDGSGERLLASEPEANWIEDPSWSPDGTLIAYTVVRPDYSYAIVLVRADGTGRYELQTGLQTAVGLSWRPR